jgi:cation:H+ antiporter
MLVTEIAFIALGLIVLLVAGDLLVRGAVGLAAALNIPALLVSLTIVAFGTSAPELFVSVNAVLTGNHGIAIGNIVGSNIANIFLVLGLPALIYPISAHVKGLRRHGVIMLAATAAFSAIAYAKGAIEFRTGAALFAGIVLYLIYMWMRSRRGDVDDSVMPEVAEYAEAANLSGRTLFFLIGGLVGLPIGAHLLVTNGAALAAYLGVREDVVGLTIIAFGTSLPELATVTAAAFHKKSDVAMGAVIGSNIFNLLAVGGAAGLAGTAAFHPAALQFDLPVMIGAALIAGYFVFARRDIGRVSGLLMCLAYAGFIAKLAINPGG